MLCAEWRGGGEFGCTSARSELLNVLLTLTRVLSSAIESRAPQSLGTWQLPPTPSTARPRPSAQSSVHSPRWAFNPGTEVRWISLRHILRQRRPAASPSVYFCIQDDYMSLSLTHRANTCSLSCSLAAGSLNTRTRRLGSESTAVDLAPLWASQCNRNAVMRL